MNMNAKESATVGLRTALSRFVALPDVDDLANILAHAAEPGRITYEEAERTVGGDPEDALLLACQQRLLVPLRSLRNTLEWDDGVVLPQAGETYKMPNVVRHMVKQAAESGKWDPEHAITRTFREMGEPHWQAMPRLVSGLFQSASNWTVSAIRIAEVCRQLGTASSVDTLIAELKAAGVMSPKLGSIAAVAKAGCPLYELNPSLLPSSRHDAVS